MPTYEYRCPDGHEFEHFVQKISLASSELPCPVCGKLAARQISAGGGFLFKGSGFYITDYGKDGKKDQRDHATKTANAKSDAAAKSEAAKGDASGKGDSSAPTASNAGDSASAKGGAAKSESQGGAGEKKAAPVAAPAPSPKKEGGKD